MWRRGLFLGLVFISRLVFIFSSLYRGHCCCYLKNGVGRGRPGHFLLCFCLFVSFGLYLHFGCRQVADSFNPVLAREHVFIPKIPCYIFFKLTGSGLLPAGSERSVRPFALRPALSQNGRAK